MPTKYELNGLSTGELLEMVDRIAREKYGGRLTIFVDGTNYYANFTSLYEPADYKPSVTLKEALIEAIVREKE